MRGSDPFWKTKSFDDFTAEEWESLCDGCARCCLEKLEDKDTGDVYYTSVACTYLDTWECRCRHYDDRKKREPACLLLTPRVVKEVHWLPTTCAYRRLAEGKDLDWWHPLVSGRKETVHEAGVSVRDKTVPGEFVPPEHLEAYILDSEL
jgi:uncharacterized cysteine cluster protein YcgN (CxxCxxCC family)